MPGVIQSLRAARRLFPALPSSDFATCQTACRTKPRCFATLTPEDAVESRPLSIGFIGAGGINFGTAAGPWYDIGRRYLQRIQLSAFTLVVLSQPAVKFRNSSTCSSGTVVTQEPLQTPREGI